VLKTDPHATELVAASQDDIDRYKKQGADWSAPDLLRLMRIGADASGAMRDSTQPLLHLEAAVLQMASLEPGKTLAEILQRLRDLEARLDGETPDAAAGPGATRASGSAVTGAVRPPARVPPARGDAMASAVPPVAAAAPAMAPPAAIAVVPAVSDESVATVVMAPAADIAGDLMERWSLVLRGVNERKRMLGAFLSESRLVAIGDRGLTLAMDDLHRTVLDDRENRALLSDEIERVFGSRLPFTCEGPQSGAATAPAPKRPLTAADVQPLIERAVEYFDGEAVQRSTRTPARPDRPREMR
jgi:DNA polymerase III subunit tau-like protein